MFKDNNINTIKIFKIFLFSFVFFSGFVFIEPSPAEFIFIIMFPFLLYKIEIKIKEIFFISLLIIPSIVSSLLWNCYI